MIKKKVENAREVNPIKIIRPRQKLYICTDPHPRKTQACLTIGKLEKKIDSKNNTNLKNACEVNPIKIIKKLQDKN